MIKKVRVDRLLNLNFWLPVCIFLGSYVVPGTDSTSLGSMILFLITILVFCFYMKGILNVTLPEHKILLVYAGYIFFDMLIIGIINPDANLRNIFLNTVINILSIFTIIVISQCLNMKKFIRVLTVIAIICMVGLLYQAFQAFVLGVEVSPIQIPFLSGAVSENNWAVASFRPQSFFSEPQAYCSYIGPFVILMLYDNRIFLALIGSATMLMTTSTTGIFLVAAIWLYWIFFKVDNIVLKIICILLFALAGIWLVNSVFFENSMSKLVGDTSFSRYERTNKGLDIFTALPLVDKFWGVGAGNLENYLSHNLFLSNVTESESNYVTSGFGNFINFGLFAGVTYIFLCIRMIIQSGKFSRLIAILILVTSFTQTISFNNWGIWWFIIFQMVRHYEMYEKCDIEGIGEYKK